MSLWDDNEPEDAREDEETDTEPIRPATSIDWSRDDDWTDEEADVNDTDPWDEPEDETNVEDIWSDNSRDDWGV